jgi:hypothetical protein
MLLQQQGKYYDNHDDKQERTIQIDIAMDPSEDEIFYEQHSIKRGRVDDHPNFLNHLNTFRVPLCSLVAALFTV